MSRKVKLGGMIKSASSLIFLFPTKRSQLRRVIDKRLKRRIFVDTQYSSFVQCVSPKGQPFGGVMYFSWCLSVLVVKK
jgi:hypothetical protein